MQAKGADTIAWSSCSDHRRKRVHKHCHRSNALLTALNKYVRSSYERNAALVLLSSRFHSRPKEVTKSNQALFAHNHPKKKIETRSHLEMKCTIHATSRFVEQTQRNEPPTLKTVPASSPPPKPHESLAPWTHPAPLQIVEMMTLLCNEVSLCTNVWSSIDPCRYRQS